MIISSFLLFKKKSVNNNNVNTPLDQTLFKVRIWMDGWMGGTGMGYALYVRDLVIIYGCNLFPSFLFFTCSFFHLIQVSCSVHIILIIIVQSSSCHTYVIDDLSMRMCTHTII